jgi:thiamine-monophosphate kinase
MGSRKMCGADPDGEPLDEFDWIANDLRPLTVGAPEALDLLDDAAAIPSRPGFDLVVSKDAMVEGVHFLPDDPLDGVAGKLLRANLSDLAAKGADPYGYFLAVGWPEARRRAERAAFAAGLMADQTRFGLKLLGGDTVSTNGPFWASLTVLGWVPAGAMTRRSAARPGDVILVSGTIGDGWLGLAAARSPSNPPPAGETWLASRYRAPSPRLGLGEALRRWGHAAADVSDGLVADAGRIGLASGAAMHIDLAKLPLARRPERSDGRVDRTSDRRRRL